ALAPALLCLSGVSASVRLSPSSPPTAGRSLAPLPSVPTCHEWPTCRALGMRGVLGRVPHCASLHVCRSIRVAGIAWQRQLAGGLQVGVVSL
ncbi:hypothetical protein DFP72DRAFT_943945, partial [Ephemerocybe angulata]